jgi:hypothetical protein
MSARKTGSHGGNINMWSTAAKASQRSSVCLVHLMVDVTVPAGSGARIVWPAPARSLFARWFGSAADRFRFVDDKKKFFIFGWLGKT